MLVIGKDMADAQWIEKAAALAFHLKLISISNEALKMLAVKADGAAHRLNNPFTSESLADAFTGWLRKFTLANAAAKPAESVFSVHDTVVSLDVARASRPRLTAWGICNA
jgi:hypothetical protein